MAIESAQYSGVWKSGDIIGVGAERTAEATRERGPDGKPLIRESYLAHGVMSGREPIQVREPIPREVYEKAVKLLAPYLVRRAMAAFPGTGKHADIGDPKAEDQD